MSQQHSATFRLVYVKLPLNYIVLITSPGGGEIWKIKKRGGCMVQGQVFLKGGREVDTFTI